MACAFVPEPKLVLCSMVGEPTPGQEVVHVFTLGMKTCLCGDVDLLPATTASAG